MQNHDDARNDLHSCEEYRSTLSRRSFFGLGALQGQGARALGAGLAATAAAWTPSTARAAGAGPQRDMLVLVFLRGGLDGLTACVPHGDGDYFALRPTLSVPAPGQTDGATDLDGFFGLPPTATPLLTPYNNGDLAFVHAAGHSINSRSHFESQSLMERGVTLPSSQEITGWLGRYLREVPAVGSGNLRGIATTNVLPQTVSGGPAVLPIVDPSVFGLVGNSGTTEARKQALTGMYAAAPAEIGLPGVQTLASIDTLAGVDFTQSPANGATYPDSDFGAQMRSVAVLAKAGIGLEVAEVDYDGWDHHTLLGPHTGDVANKLDDLSRTLEAFYLDLQADLGRITVVVMSEFGRRADENGSAGVDHGSGGLMMLMGGNVNGGQVFGTWPGLGPAQLDRDALAVTTDYRDVLAEVVTDRLGHSSLGAIFPGYSPTFLGVTT